MRAKTLRTTVPQGEEEWALFSTHSLLSAGLTFLAWAASLRADNVLSVEVAGSACCVHPGDTVMVYLTVSALAQSINGVQAVIQFDNQLLSFNRITPGDGAGSPWDAGVGLQDLEGGILIYSIVILGGGTTSDAVVATLRLVAIAEGTAVVQLLPSHPPVVTKLTGYPNNEPIIPELQGPIFAVIGPGSDGNADGRVDLTDYAHFAACLTGPVGPIVPPAYPVGPPLCCTCFDADEDGDVDVADFAEFQTVFEIRGQESFSAYAVLAYDRVPDAGKDS